MGSQGADVKSYIYQITHGCLSHDKGLRSDWTWVGRQQYVCGSGDIVEMVLDFRSLTLSYAVNDIFMESDDATEGLRQAFYVEDTPYRAAVAAYSVGDAIELM